MTDKLETTDKMESISKLEITDAEGEQLSDEEAEKLIAILQNGTMCLSQRR